jgi:hypothetical protein
VLKKAETLTKVVKMYKIGEQKTMLTIKSDPDGATLFINDKKTNAVTPTVVNIPVGLDIKIRAEKENYFPVEQNIGKVAANINKEISLVLKPIKDSKDKKASIKRANVSSKSKAIKSGKAFISINSRPWANVYIDGKLIKSTPIIKYAIDPGKHKVHFKNQKFNINKVYPVVIGNGEHKRMIKNFN